jgi:hypothetical protein
MEREFVITAQVQQCVFRHRIFWCTLNALARTLTALLGPLGMHDAVTTGLPTPLALSQAPRLPIADVRWDRGRLCGTARGQGPCVFQNSSFVGLFFCLTTTPTNSVFFNCFTSGRWRLEITTVAPTENQPTFSRCFSKF